MARKRKGTAAGTTRRWIIGSCPRGSWEPLKAFNRGYNYPAMERNSGLDRTQVLTWIKVLPNQKSNRPGITSSYNAGNSVLSSTATSSRRGAFKDYRPPSASCEFFFLSRRLSRRRFNRIKTMMATANAARTAPTETPVAHTSTGVIIIRLVRQLTCNLARLPYAIIGTASLRWCCRLGR